MSGTLRRRQRRPFIRDLRSINPHLNARFRERRFRGETLARRHAGVMRPLKLFLEFLELLWAEGRTIAPKLRLLRAVQASIVPVTVYISRETRFLWIVCVRVYLIPNAIRSRHSIVSCWQSLCAIARLRVEEDSAKTDRTFVIIPK